MHSFRVVGWHGHNRLDCVCFGYDNKMEVLEVNHNKKWQYLYNSRWANTARAYLRSHPLCVYCLEVGKTTKSEVVDHIKPHKGNYKTFWDRSNWQALCKHCHDSIKAIEESRGYRIGCDENGVPLDKGHGWNKD